MLHILSFGYLNGDNKSINDYDLNISKVVNLFDGTSAINVKSVDFVKRKMRDTTTWLLPAWKNCTARLLFSSIKRGNLNLKFKI